MRFHPISDTDNHADNADNAGNNVTIEAPWSCSTVCLNLRGKLMILSAGVLAVIKMTIVKKFAQLPVGQFVATIFLIVSVLNLACLFFSEPSYEYKGKAKFVVTRAFFGALGGFLKMWAARVMPIGDLNAIYSLMPVFAALFSRVLRKEKANIFTFIALFVGLVGICLVARPPFIFGGYEEETNSFYPLLPLLSAIVNGLACSCMRKVGTAVSPQLITSNIALFVIVDCLLFHAIMRDEVVLPDCYTDRIAITAGAAVNVLALYLLNKGLAIEKSGPGTMIRNFDIVTAYLIQIAFFGTIPDALSIVGALLVLSKALLVSASKLFFEKMFREF